MRIAVIGVGHVGLVSAACFAEWGHDVIGVDDDAERVRVLQAGDVPFFEPGLQELVGRHRDQGRLTFSNDLATAIDGVDVLFVCVGTPSLPGGGPNLAFVEAVGRQVAESATGDLVLVEKSTVPVNTGTRLAQVIAREQARVASTVTIDVASNPEFLREGNAVEDTLRPDRIVVGVGGHRAEAALREVYARPVDDGVPLLVTDVATAELIKHSSNAFLAMKISFVNALARICDLTGADVEQVTRGMGYDERIGDKFLRPGIGYGGSCFPKDVDAFIHIARDAGFPFHLLEQVRDINVGQRELVLDHLRSELWHLQDKTITLLGAAFKPGTDDLREAPAIHIAKALLAEGASVRIYDPVALAGVEAQVPEATTVDDPLEACRGAHAVVLCTEWDQVKALDLEKVRQMLAYPVFIDGRNVFEPRDAVAAGLQYRSIGRPVPGGV